MKKLTWLLMSLMLFLGMGTAFAGYWKTNPTFSPASGSVTPGQEITFTLPGLEEGMTVDDYSFLAVLYDFEEDYDDLTTFPGATAEVLQQYYNAYVQNDGTAPDKAYKVLIGILNGEGDMQGWVGEDHIQAITIPADAAAGSLYFTARVVGLRTNGTTIDRPGAGEDFEATYTVTGGSGPVTPTKPDAPTFNPAGGEIQAASTVAISGNADDIWYCIDCEDADLSQTGLSADKCFSYETPIKLYKDATLKAVAVKGDRPPFTLSDIATATYTVTGGENVLPSLTLTPSENPVVMTGTTATFSCTMDPKQYTASSNKIGFAIALENAGNIANLEYQVGETMDPDGAWTAYGERYLKGYAAGSYIAAIPNNGNPTGNARTVAIAPTTVHYRITLNGGTSAKITFTVAEASNSGTWPTTVTNVFAESPIQFKSKPAKPTFTVEAGEVPFGTSVELEAAGTIYYTTDGTTPTEESTEFERWDEIIIAKDMTIKAIAVSDGLVSEVAEAAYTVAPVENAVLTLSPMKDDSVGKNVAVDVAFSDGTPMSAGWVQAFPASVYYTTDGTTVPSKEAYEAQEGDGIIKMISVEWDEYGPVQDGAGNLLPLTFGEATRLKAIGYLMDGADIVLTTAVLDTLLQVKSEVNPMPSIVNYAEIKAGDTLVITNPNAWPAMPDDDASDEEWEEWQASTDGLPVTVMYYSFDGTLPTEANRFAEKEIENVFSTDQQMGENITILFKEDEEGLYAYVPAIFEIFYDPDSATIRIKDGKFSMQVLAVTPEAQEGGDGPMPYPGWGPSAPTFKYGSDFVTFEYYTTAATLTFDPESGSEVDENTAVSILADQNVDIFYMMFESEEAAKAAEWDVEAAELYGEMKPVLSPEKTTIKAAYARPDAEAVAETFFYATYTVKELPAIELTFNPASGSTVKAGTEVTVTASRETEIFYCLYADKAAADADEAFMANAKEVVEDGKPVITKEATFLRCGVFDKGGMKYFDAEYKIEVANEGEEELAGASVYPNPSNGLFNLELPVAATVEVFMSNGMLYQRLTLGEGNTTLNINRSGIYFLRITGEGRTAIKRLIVR